MLTHVFVNSVNNTLAVDLSEIPENDLGGILSTLKTTFSGNNGAMTLIYDGSAYYTLNITVGFEISSDLDDFITRLQVISDIVS